MLLLFICHKHLACIIIICKAIKLSITSKLFCKSLTSLKLKMWYSGIMFLYFTLNSRFLILSQKLETNHRRIFFSSIERFKAILNLECFFASLRSIRLKLKLFHENFFVHSLFVLLVNVAYFVDQNTNNQCGIFKTLWPHASGISAMLSIEAFLFGN